MSGLSGFIIFLELGLIIFIGILYFIAWRELNARAIQRQSPLNDELKELCDAVERVMASLELRVSDAEARLGTVIQEAESVSQSVKADVLDMKTPQTTRTVRFSSGSHGGDTAIPLPPPPPDAAAVSGMNGSSAMRPAGDSALAASIGERVQPASFAGDFSEPAAIALDQPVAPDPPVEAAAEQAQAESAPAPDPYAQVYALFDEGIVDYKEIARRSGFGLAEVLLVLSLRPR